MKIIINYVKNTEILRAYVQNMLLKRGGIR
jgi:hypothetical protein